MNIYFSEKLKSLRADKKVSQEKLAQYLNVSFHGQHISRHHSAAGYRAFFRGHRRRPAMRREDRREASL